MEQSYVTREEFKRLAEKVDHVERQQDENVKILQAIDKKVDVITEKITTSDRIEDLKLNPLTKRVSEVEDNQKWLWRTVIGTIIATGLKILFDVSKILK